MPKTIVTRHKTATRQPVTDQPNEQAAQQFRIIAANFARNALQRIESAESLMSVAALALREQDVDNDHAIADVLECHAWGEIDEARNQLRAVLELVGAP